MEALAEAIREGIAAWIDDSWSRCFAVIGSVTVAIAATILAARLA